MLNLQLVLAIIGVIVVLLIYLISRWQNRLRRPISKSAHPNKHSVSRDFAADDMAPDPIGHNRIGEPIMTEARANRDSMATAPEPTRPAGDSVLPDGLQEPIHDAHTPVLTSTPEKDAPEKDASEKDAPEYRNHTVDGFDQLSQIDYWVKITGERDVGRETVLALYRNGGADFSKARSLHGFKTPDQVWCDVEHEAEDARFTDLVITIQLADRNGAISEREMTRFSALVSRLSEGTGREFVFMTPVTNALAQADAIADFARRFDSIFAVNVRPREAECFDGPVIDRCAPQIGLERDENRHYSRFKSIGKDKVALYSLADLSDTGRFDFDNLQSFSTRGLTFFTRPAVNRSPGAVFAEMVDTARAFASRIKGEVNSPDHGDLSQETIDATRKSIEQVAAEMEHLGIAAGSDEATRIF